MLPLMEQNIARNGLQSAVQAAVYNWGEPVPTGLPNPPQIIIAADCVYFEPAFALLHSTLVDLIGENTICYFCFKKRRRADLRFMKIISKSLEVREVTDDPDRQIYSREALFLYVLTKRR